MRRVFLTDLDDSLFQSGRKTPGGEATPVAFKKDGSPAGFMTPAQLSFFGWLEESGEVYPITARDSESLSRVRLPFGKLRCVDHGAFLLEGDSPVAEWAERTERQARRGSEELEWILGFLGFRAARISERVRTQAVSDFGLDLYALAKSLPYEASDLDRLEADLRRELSEKGLIGWRIARNGNNLACLPDWLDKGPAAAEMARRAKAEEETIVIGLGDSLTDANFLKACDFGMFPKESQIARAGLANSTERK